MNSSDDLAEDDNAWYRDSDYPMDWWQRDVENDATEEGYNRWLVARYEEDGKTVPQIVLDQVYSYQDAGLDEYGRADLAQRYRDRYPVEEWKAEVENLDTKNGYESWLMNRVESCDEEWEREQDALREAKRLDEETPAAPGRDYRPRM